MKEPFSFETDRQGGVILDVGPHCVMTAAKKAHGELVMAFISGTRPKAELVTAAEILRDFLTGTDFAALRAKDLRLAGTLPGRVRLERAPGGTVRWEILAEN